MKQVFLATLLAIAVAIAAAGCARDTPEPELTPGLSPIATLGERIFKDPSLSVSGKLSCESCHRPEFAHGAPPQDAVSKGGPDSGRPGLRNAPSIRYASFTPAFHFDTEGTPTGGLFRDGRTDSLVDQARQPFLDAREMANADVDEVIARLRGAPYAEDFAQLFGANSLADPARAFDALGAAIAQYQLENPDFHRFDSKYDAWLSGRAALSDAERRGLNLFNDPLKGNCAACHPSERAADGSPPLFTDFTYDNLGLARSARVPANAEASFFDLGLCGPERRDLAARREFCGAFKVPTLRNVAITAPYFHNGSFDDLREVVDFYARRDTHPADWYPALPSGVRRFDDLPEDLKGGVNTQEVPYGRKPGEEPALTPAEIDDVVAFLKTLDDGYHP